MSGLQIFNAHPSLYIGSQSGFDFDNSVLKIETRRGPDSSIIGVTSLFGYSFETTGLLGASGSAETPQNRAFQPWATVPSYQDLATGRVIHFFFAWLLVAALLVWLVASLINGHILRDIVPRMRDIRNLPRDIADHARFRFHSGRSYNVLQKFSYVVVMLIIFPVLILTGLTMSPGADASWTWLLDLFGGRQTARSIHFLCMVLLVLFFIVHILMVFAAGPINELRSIITGWYRANAEPTKDGDRT